MTSSISPFSVSAPGSLMLMGEHAVLHGHPALCMAVEPRITLTFTPGRTREVHIQSDFGQIHGDLDQLPENPDLRFVLECLRHTSPTHGFDLTITSDLDATKGLGTSAAVTVAMVAGLRELSGQPFDPGSIASTAREVIRTVQGTGSGSDAAASAFGGIVRIHPDPFRIEPIQARASFWMSYAGYKTPTPEVIEHVETLRRSSPELMANLFETLHLCVDASVQAIRQGDWEKVGQLMTQHHYVQGALGTSDETLDRMVHTFRQHPDILGAKISGSGLGDSVLALGNLDPDHVSMDLTQVTLAEHGVQIHERR